MYDISGTHNKEALEVIAQDWPHLTRDLHLTDSPSYIYDHGRPVVGVWGFGFKDRDLGPGDASAIIRYFRAGTLPATVLGGVPASWRNLGVDSRWMDARPEPSWHAVYH